MKKRDFLKDSSGSIAISTVILMVVFVGLMAFAIDLGHLFTVKNELQNAADAAALAGARRIYPMTGPPPWSVTDPPPCTEAREAAKATAASNKASQASISVLDSEVVFGLWDFSTRQFAPGPGTTFAATNAVKVTARMRSDLSQGSVVMSAAKVFGVNTVDVQATAIAAVGNLNTLPEGSSGGFIGANDEFLRRIYNDGNYDPNQKYYLILGSAGGQLNWQYADNGGWVSPVGMQPTPPYLKDVVDNGTTFEMTAGTTQAKLSNGEETPVIVDIKNHVSMEVTIPSFNTDMWNQDQTIQNFWNITITDAYKPGDKLPDNVLENLRPLDDGNGKLMNAVGVIEFTLEGLFAVNGAGGGPPSNVFATLPKLVQ